MDLLEHGQVEIEAQRTQTVNEGVIFDVLVKPTLSEIRTEITEYDFPDPEAAPLYPRFDGKQHNLDSVIQQSQGFGNSI